MFFFFSSRRRHTRFDCDWSSDVCSSDLLARRIDCVCIFSCAPKPTTTIRFAANLPMECKVINSPSSALNRSEEHTSELQSQSNLVCRLLLEKKKKQHSIKL